MSDHVDVVGSGSATAVPDVVVVDTRVQVDADDVASALADTAARVTAALQAAADHGVSDTDRRTTGMGMSTRWDRDGRTVVGYTAHQTLRLAVRDRDRTGALLSALAGAAGDAFGVDNVSLEVTDRGPLVERAREAAFADARTTAEQLARLAGRPLGPVLRVTDQPNTDRPMPALRTMSAEAADGMPVAAGESTVTLAVAVRFELGPV
ncbi:MAG: SIMPL domain-containing protein [Dermatophilaceae bacterium]